MRQSVVASRRSFGCYMGTRLTPGCGVEACFFWKNWFGGEACVAFYPIEPMAVKRCSTLQKLLKLVTFPKSSAP